MGSWKSRCSARTSTPTAAASATRRLRGVVAFHGPIDGLERVRSRRRIRATSPMTSSPPWPRRRTSARRCTCRCSPAPTMSCADAPQLPGRAVSRIIERLRAAIPAPPSRPTSSSASRRDRGDFQATLTWFAPPASPEPSRSSTPSARVRPPLNCPTRSTHLWWPTGTAGSSRCRTRCRGRPTGRSWVGEVEALRRRVKAEGRGHRRMSGRARDGRLVHLNAHSEQPPRPGDFASTVITRGGPTISSRTDR